MNKTKSKRPEIPIVTINSVKWVVDAHNELMWKKNKPAVKHKIDDIFNSVDDATKEAIYKFI